MKWLRGLVTNYQPGDSFRSRRARHSGSATARIAMIFLSLKKKRSTKCRCSSGAMMRPGHPSTTAGNALCARPLKASATALAPRISGSEPWRVASQSARKTASGSSTDTSASKLPPRAAARKASTSFHRMARSALSAFGKPCTRRRARLASWRVAVFRRGILTPLAGEYLFNFDPR